MREGKAQGKGWYGEIQDPFKVDYVVSPRKTAPVPEGCEPPINAGGLLRSGVYLLYWRTKVIYIGRSYCMFMAIAAHRTAASGPRLPEWFPVKGLIFDDFGYITTSYDRTLVLMEALIAYHRPAYNQSRTQIKKTDKEGPPPIDQTQLVRRL